MVSGFLHHITNSAPGGERKVHPGQETPLYQLLPFMLIYIMSFLFSCSSSGKSSGSSAGSISFMLHAPHNQSSVQLASTEDDAASIPCTEWQIATVEAQVLDENNSLIAQGGPWDCSVGQGTIVGVTPGTNRSVIINLKNASGTVVLSGKKTNITVITGQTTDLGVIEVSGVNWITSFNTGTGGAESVIQTSDGGYVIAGSTKSATDNNAVSLIKTDGNGTMVWNKTFGGSTSNDGAASVQQASDGGYIVAGYTTPISLNALYHTAALLIKTDANGNLDTSFGIGGQKTFGGTNNDYANSVRQIGDGGYVIAGQTYSYGSGNGDAWLIKTDASGTLDTSFGTEGMQTFASGISGSASADCVQPVSSGYVIAGYTAVSSGTEAWLIKTDAAGTMSWNKTFNAANASGGMAYSVRQTTDNGYIMAGVSFKSSGGNDALLAKTDADGNLDTAFGNGGIRTFIGSGTGTAVMSRPMQSSRPVTGICRCRLYRL